MAESGYDPKTRTYTAEDGTETKLALESDVLAQKTKAEGLERQLKESEQSWNTKLDESKTATSTAQQAQYAAEAQLKELQEKLTTANLSVEELAKVKTELDSIKTGAEETKNRALEYRRKLIAKEFGVSEDTVANKTMEQLDSYEEALKAVKSATGSKTSGVVTGGGSGAGAPETPLDRARRITSEAFAKAGQPRQD